MLSQFLFSAFLLAFPLPDTGQSTIIPVRLTCKQVSSCEEAVSIWCDGYRRADGDGDGIPCENVCHSNEQVDEIRAQQGC
jgi:hypothetical protein